MHPQGAVAVQLVPSSQLSVQVPEGHQSTSSPAWPMVKCLTSVLFSGGPAFFSSCYYGKLEGVDRKCKAGEGS